MKKTIILILISKRTEAAVAVQDVLTKHGCFIKTRLGIHEDVENRCSENGLIILELVGEDNEKQMIFNELEKIEGVNVKIVDLEI